MRFLLGLLAGAATASALAALLAPQFRLQRLEVHGAPADVRAEVEAAAQRFLAETATLRGAPRLLLIQHDRLAEAVLAAVPRVHTVQVLRQLPGTLVLNLQEKVAVAFLTTPDGRTLALDGAGVMIADVPLAEATRAQLPLVRSTQPAPDVRPGTPVVSRNLVDLLHEVVVLLSDRLGVSVEELVIPSPGAREVHVRTSAGWRLLLDSDRRLADQLRAFEQVLADELPSEARARLESVDLRVPGKVYYRLRAGPFPPPAPTRP